MHKDRKLTILQLKVVQVELQQVHNRISEAFEGECFYMPDGTLDLVKYDVRDAVEHVENAIANLIV